MRPTWTSTLDAEQIALRDAVRGLLTKGSDAGDVGREVASTEPGWDDRLVDTARRDGRPRAALRRGRRRDGRGPDRGDRSSPRSSAVPSRRSRSSQQSPSPAGLVAARGVRPSNAPTSSAGSSRGAPPSSAFAHVEPR
ncbi:MAG: hypothetical protein WKF83_06310 [Nocardioidaceae bacterium]